MRACSILVVDDDEELRELIRLVLEAAGHTVDTASNGQEARRVFALWSFEVLLTDLLMPECDGLELIAEVVKKKKGVRIVAMSGGGHVASDQYLQMAKSFGAHVLLPKPFSHEELLRAVEQARAGAESDAVPADSRPAV